MYLVGFFPYILIIFYSMYFKAYINIPIPAKIYILYKKKSLISFDPVTECFNRSSRFVEEIFHTDIDTKGQRYSVDQRTPNSPGR